jgi:hypothetical protein
MSGFPKKLGKSVTAEKDRGKPHLLEEDGAERVVATWQLDHARSVQKSAKPLSHAID